METHESKKRKMIISNDVDAAEADDEEEKIEKFFALINNIREARHRLMNGSNVILKGEEINDNRSNKKKKKKEVEEEEEKVIADVWKPSFQPEDLIEEEAHHEFKIPHVISGISTTNNAQSRGCCNTEICKQGNNLDLRLSL
ncbi:uncharacterized protein LOC110755705 [Prunus avium]|uniref:Uncharacterized protein LOC110755705 n=1 Tax=Prunus avium TaxID=42229 RepID=A0A6P5S9V5_PRUAV|nr:uncharacterized protein LOC110755705 [Prunus avium]